jgi:hypothetical protein
LTLIINWRIVMTNPIVRASLVFFAAMALTACGEDGGNVAAGAYTA